MESKNISPRLIKTIWAIVFILIVLNSFGIKYRVTGTMIKDSTVELAEKHILIIEDVLINPTNYNDDFYNDMRYDVMKHIENVTLTKWEVEITSLLQDIYSDLLRMKPENLESVSSTRLKVEEKIHLIEGKIN